MERRELSNQFYDYMCNIVGSEEVVKKRRKVFMALDSVIENLEQTFISSGSKTKGFELEGNDYDITIVDNHVDVYEGIHDVSSSLHGLTFIMDTTDTKQGFTKLKVDETSGRYLPLSNKWCETFEQRTYVSSKLYLEYHLPQHYHVIIHDPCVSSKDGLDDFAYSFQCKKLINPCKQWIFRSNSTWPEY